ncbi:TRAP-type C4-dicarboxylate transport system permease small subunit [Tibeticola sediminis]|uniref:TRAP transporter small permease protein n=1 Tax=Tibeticola sediminis TaxID=1917811 RepID=A0A3N4UVU2_9BURK|nr:TRAP transporter small permease [Tibeticola sediminis]RPE72915.1 TRAP-type C4-dicarboxylate transport system permease small subunit [Tibeticola sediminis]
MRRVLDTLYDGAAGLAALFLLGLLTMVLLAIVSRLWHFMVPGIDAYAGYLMAASGFLALAHTFKRGEHIRVTLLLNLLQGRWRRALELWALAVSTLLAWLFAFYAAKLTWESWQFNDISTGNDATPLWIPQLGMAVGALIFAIALLDELCLEALGRQRPKASAEALRNE